MPKDPQAFGAVFFYIPVCERAHYENCMNDIQIFNDDLASIALKAREANEVHVYEHPLFGKIRMFLQNGKTWFCGTDIATSLGYSNTRDAIVRHCKSQGVVIHDTPTNSGVQQMKFISEGNVYRLTAKSQMPKADEFESWIFDDIVPSVMQKGSYSIQQSIPNFNNPAEAARAWADQYERAQALVLEKRHLEVENEQNRLIIKEQTVELNQAAPKVEYYDNTLSSTGYLTVNMIAACLGISDVKLNKLLCLWGIQYKESKVYYLYSKYRNKGYTVHRPYLYRGSTGEIKTRQHMYWTEVGKKFIIEFYNSKIVA